MLPTIKLNAGRNLNHAARVTLVIAMGIGSISGLVFGTIFAAVSIRHGVLGIRQREINTRGIQVKGAEAVLNGFAYILLGLFVLFGLAFWLTGQGHQ